jgi:hypothetical protein
MRLCVEKKRRCGYKCCSGRHPSHSGLKQMPSSSSAAEASTSSGSGKREAQALQQPRQHISRQRLPVGSPAAGKGLLAAQKRLHDGVGLGCSGNDHNNNNHNHNDNNNNIQLSCL